MTNLLREEQQLRKNTENKYLQLQDCFDQTTKTHEKLQIKFNELNTEYDELKHNNRELQNELNTVKLVRDKVTETEHKYSQTPSEQNADLEKLKDIENEHIARICQLSNQLAKVEAQCENYRQQTNKMDELSTELNTKDTVISNQLSSLLQYREELDYAKKELCKIETINNEIGDAYDKLRHDFETVVATRNEDYDTFQKLTEDITIELREYKNIVENDLAMLHQNQDKIAEKYENTSQILQTLKDEHRKLIEELLRTIAMLIDERVMRQTVIEKYEDLQARHKVNDKRIEELLVEANVLRSRANTLLSEKEQILITLKAIEEQIASQEIEKQSLSVELQNLQYEIVINDKSVEKIEPPTNDDHLLEAEALLSELQAKNKSLEQHIELLKADIGHKHEHVIELRKKICKLEAELAQMQFEYKKIKMEQASSDAMISRSMWE